MLAWLCWLACLAMEPRLPATYSPLPLPCNFLGVKEVLHLQLQSPLCSSCNVGSSNSAVQGRFGGEELLPCLAVLGWASACVAETPHTYEGKCTPYNTILHFPYFHFTCFFMFVTYVPSDDAVFPLTLWQLADFFHFLQFHGPSGPLKMKPGVSVSVDTIAVAV